MGEARASCHVLGANVLYVRGPTCSRARADVLRPNVLRAAPAGDALGLAAINPLWWGCNLRSGGWSWVGAAAAGQAADRPDRHIVFAQTLTGQPDPAHALGREHVSLGDGHSLGFTLDEFDAAGCTSGIAPAGVQDIHPSVLLNGKHETLPIGNVNRAKTFNCQSRHRLQIIPEAMISYRPRTSHVARRTSTREHVRSDGTESTFARSAWHVGRATRRATAQSPPPARARFRRSGRCSARRRAGGTRPPPSSPPAVPARRTGAASCRTCLSSSATSSSARMPVESIAVMLRSLTITIGGSSSICSVIFVILSVMPKRNGPWMRKMATYRRNRLVLQNVRPPGFHVFGGDPRHGRGHRDAVDVEQCRQDHPDLHGQRQIREHRQRERGEPHADVRLGQLQQLRDLVPFPHVVGHDQQDGGQHRHGDEFGQRGGDDQHDQQGEGVDACRPPACVRQSGCSSRSARSHRLRAGPRRSARRCSQRPARRARRSGCDDRRSSGPRRPRT